MREIKSPKFKTIHPKEKVPKGFIKPVPMERISSLDDLIAKVDIFKTIIFTIGKDKYRIEKNPDLTK